MNRWAHSTRRTAATLGLAVLALSSNALPIHEVVSIEGDMQALCIKNYAVHAPKTVYVLTATTKKVDTIPSEVVAHERIGRAHRFALRWAGFTKVSTVKTPKIDASFRGYYLLALAFRALNTAVADGVRYGSLACVGGMQGPIDRVTAVIERVIAYPFYPDTGNGVTPWRSSAAMTTR